MQSYILLVVGSVQRSPKHSTLKGIKEMRIFKRNCITSVIPLCVPALLHLGLAACVKPASLPTGRSKILGFEFYIGSLFFFFTFATRNCRKAENWPIETRPHTPTRGLFFPSRTLHINPDNEPNEPCTPSYPPLSYFVDGWMDG